MDSILVIGYMMLDIKGNAPLTYAPKERNVGNISLCPGGVARNVAVNLARCDVPVSFVTLSDADGTGDHMINVLLEDGMKVYYRRLSEGGIGKWMVIIRPGDGETLGQISAPPSKEALEELVYSKCEELIKEASSIVLEVEISYELTEFVLNLAKKYNKPVYSIVSNLSILEEHEDVLPQISCFVCNEKEFAKLSHSDIPSYTQKDLQKWILQCGKKLGLQSCIITLGAKGAMYEDFHGTNGFVPPIDVPVLDGTGAGDAFLAGVVKSLNEGYDLGQAAQFGTELAARTISSYESTIPKKEGN